MRQSKPEKPMEQVITEDGRYPAEAFSLLQEGLKGAISDNYSQADKQPGEHHVAGKQICLAIRDLAAERWGMLAPTVLASWNIHATIDFGQMVYLLIENGFMHKTDDDSIEDFRDIFDLAEAFNDVDKFEPAK